MQNVCTGRCPRSNSPTAWELITMNMAQWICNEIFIAIFIFIFIAISGVMSQNIFFWGGGGGGAQSLRGSEATERGEGVGGAKIIFPTGSSGPPVRTHLHTANQSYMIWIWMTCVFGIRVRMRVDLLFIAVRKRHARCNTTKFTCKNGDLRLPYNLYKYCTMLSLTFRGPCHWSWTITLVRGKLTLF